jgi:hypothetical protein
MTDEKMNSLYSEVLEMDVIGLLELRKIAKESNSGGKQREFHGKHNENVVKYLIRKIGEDCKRTIAIKKGEKEDKHFITNFGGKIPISLDWHVYADDIFKIGSEIKGYMDTTMVKRCLYEAEGLKTLFPDITIIIVQFENGLGRETSGYLQSDENIDLVVNFSGRKRNSKIKRFNNSNGCIKNNEDFREFCAAVCNSFKNI